jgi:hypothetical protein
LPRLTINLAQIRDISQNSDDHRPPFSFPGMTRRLITDSADRTVFDMRIPHVESVESVVNVERSSVTCLVVDALSDAQERVLSLNRVLLALLIKYK